MRLVRHLFVRMIELTYVRWRIYMNFSTADLLMPVCRLISLADICMCVLLGEECV